MDNEFTHLHSNTQEAECSLVISQKCRTYCPGSERNCSHSFSAGELQCANTWNLTQAGGLARILSPDKSPLQDSGRGWGYV